MKKLLHPLSLIAVLLFIAIGLAAWLLPLQLAHHVKLAVEAQTGRIFSVANGAGWSLRHGPSLVLNDVKLEGVSALSQPIITARHAMIGWSGLVVLEDADVTISRNALGHSNFLSGNETAPEKFTPRTVQFQNTRFHFNDEQSNLKLLLSEVSGSFTMNEDGRIEGAGSGTLNERIVQFTTALDGFVRLIDDGCPFDLNLSTPQEQFAFSGRLLLKNGLALTGQASLDSNDLAKSIEWSGNRFKGLSSALKLSLVGPIDVQNADVSFKTIALNLGNAKAKGDLDFSFGSDRPSSSAALGFDVFDLNVFGNAETGRWNDKPFDRDSLQALDVDFRIAANKVLYRSYVSGPAQVNAALMKGNLQLTFKSDAGSNLEAQFNGEQMQLKSHMVDFAVPLGEATIDVEATSSGSSETEMISKLQGRAVADFKKLKLNSLNATGKASFDISDGIATIASSAFGNFSVLGEIDVLRRAVSVSTSAINGNKLLIHGSWSKPEISEIEATLQ